MGRKSRAKQTTAAPRETVVVAAPPRVAQTEWWIAGILIALCLLVFGQVASHQFLNYDDGQLIYENAAVRSGLNPPAVTWALTSFDIGWYPLTWLSHELDVTLWGLKPGAHLLMQLLLHAASTLVLFFALRRMTGATIRSGFVAALFAIHPMHVESVAWASERKDTLSTLFAMLVLYVYASREESTRKKVAVAALLAASLMAKQMYVTMPFLLLVLDWWPLKRGLRIAEKIPLLALAVIASAIALIGQRNLKALQSVEALPIGTRIANALDGYLRYLGKLVWPAKLAVPYPMTAVRAIEVLLALVLLAAVTAGAWLLRKRAPYVLTGWLWFLGTLVPVIGIIQIGPQSIADRYTYFAYIGLFIAIVWGVAELLPARAAIAIGGAVVLVLAGVAWHQVRYWKDSETLFLHAIAVTGPNPLAEYSLGQTLQMSAPDRAIAHLERAIALIRQALAEHPNVAAPEWYAQSYVAMATAKLMQARVAPPPQREPLIASAERDLHQALAIDPNAAHAKNNLGVAAAMRQQFAAAPATNADAFLNAGTQLSQQGRFADAVTEFRKAVAAAPRSPETHVYLGLGLLQAKQFAEAREAFEAAMKLDEAQANDVVTRALRLPPKPDNLRNLIASIPR
jgi:protein O-mannosyl-transferase